MIDIEKIYNWIGIILCLLVMGEACALIIGMNLSGSEGKEWLSFKNYAFLICDVITGLVTCILIFINHDKNYSTFIISLLVLIIITHLYREIEYIFQVANKFCENIPLFIFNNIKLIISLLCISMGIFVNYFAK